MSASEVIDSASMSVSVLELDSVNFNVFFRDVFLALTLAWPDARDTIFPMFCIR